MTRAISVFLLFAFFVTGFAFSSPDEDEIRRLCSMTIDSVRFPDAKAVVLMKRVEIVLDDSGNNTEEVFYIVKFLGYAGMKKYENIRVNYNSGLWDIKVLPCFTVHPSGKFDTLIANEINFITPDYINERASAYSKAKTVVFSFPALTESSSVVVHYILESRGKPDYPYSWYFPFADTDPVLNFRLVVKFPAGRRLNYKLFNADKVPYLSKNELIIEYDTLDALQEEPLSPSFVDFRPSIALTLLSSWDAIRDYIGNKFFPYIERESDFIKEKLSLLGNELERVFVFVADSISTVPIDIRDEMIEPIAPDSVVRQKYGDPFQKIILLGGLLRLMGYDVYPLLLPRLDSEPELDIPFFEQFRSFALLAVKGADTVFLDPSSDTAPAGLIPDYYGRTVLKLSRDRLDFIKVQGKKPSVELKIEMVLNEFGGVKGRYELSCDGSAAASLRKLFKGEKPRKIRMQCEEFISDFSRKTRLEHYEVLGVENSLEPFKISLSFSADSFAFFQKDLMLVNLPIISIPELELYPDVSLDERKLPMMLGEPLSVIAEFVLTSPPGFEFTFFPQKIEHFSELGKYSIASEERDTNVKIYYELTRDSYRVSQSQYNDIVKLYRGFKAPKNWLILLKRRS